MPDFDISGFLPEFFDEARQRLQSINRKLVMFETGALDENALIQLRRDAHTIKGSAQMLGVQDVSESGHLFEDAIDYATTCPPDKRQAVIQFLYDMHDMVEQRLQHADAKLRLDTAAMAERFNQLRQAVTNGVGVAKPEPEKPAEAAPAQKRRRKKRSRVPVNLIAAIKGSIEESLQPERSGEHQQPDKAETGDAPVVKQAEAIDFRPDVATLECNDVVAHGSGNFLRVDRTRLTRLSNQIIELGSGRYQDAFPQQQLQQIAQALRQLKKDPRADAHAQALWQAEFDRQIRQLQYFGGGLQEQQRRATAMLDDLRDQVFGLMLKPLTSVFSIFPRTVRNIAKQCDRKVQLLVAGDAVEMDQRTAEALTAPLIHLINNAVAHGIESPAERSRCGKPVEGQISIVASQKGREVQIVVSDDGRGMDIERIRAQAIAIGMISQTEAAEMDASEMMELVFQPGFSTQPEVSAIAGRGMGMSVVSDVVHELTGAIRIHSEQGRGSRFTLMIPVSVTVQQARVFRIAGQNFGMLDNLIRRVIAFNQLEIKKGHGPYSNGYIDFEQHRAPIIDFRQALNNEAGMRDGSSVMIVEHLEGFLGLVVDEIVAEKEVLVREIDPYLKRYHPVGLMGCTITRDGNVLLLIDPDGLKEMWRTAPDPALTTGVSGAFNQRMMLVDDSIIALKIEKSMFESMGFSVDVAVGGTDALEKIGLHDYDLLVTDLGMPDMDGIALVEHLRALDTYRSLPILMLATLEAEDEKQRSLAAGADAYLVKRHLKDGTEQLLTTLSSLLAAADMPAMDEEGV